MDFTIRRWSHDWENFNFAGVTMTYDGKADGITTLSPEDVMEYMEWLAINDPKRYGQIMMASMDVAGGAAVPAAARRAGLVRR